MYKLSIVFTGILIFLLAGCTVPPSSTIKTPLTARPAERDLQIPHNGSIFQAGKFEHPLFEDRHPRNVGDILTINIVETISATQSASNSADNKSSMSASIPSLKSSSTAMKLGTSSTGTLSNKSAYSGANTFSGTITVTVVEVLPNGNLLVGGEKQMSINQSNGYIRFSGVVDPANITTSSTGFTVQSTLVSDAHIDYKDADNIDASQIMTSLGRAFMSILPF